LSTESTKRRSGSPAAVTSSMTAASVGTSID
jgi:hypothetical protein